MRAALNSDRPPKYERAPRGPVADAHEPQIRFLLNEWPTMLAPIVAERIGWSHSLSPLKRKLAQIRPEYVGINPVDRVTYEPGEITQCDLCLPEPKAPVARGQERILPALVMTPAGRLPHQGNGLGLLGSATGSPTGLSGCGAVDGRGCCCGRGGRGAVAPLRGR